MKIPEFVIIIKQSCTVYHSLAGRLLVPVTAIIFVVLSLR